MKNLEEQHQECWAAYLRWLRIEAHAGAAVQSIQAEVIWTELLRTNFYELN